MRNIKLTLAYDGTDYCGWQIQPGQPTIQGALTEAARKLTEEEVVIHGAGRTDSGVHATGQVAHFRTQSGLTMGEFQRAFNALLPPAIRVVEVMELGPDFHARWGALAKTYEYRIYRGTVVPPFVWRYVLHHPFPLDVGAMKEAAAKFEGQHDFTSFSASSGSEDNERERTMVREIYSSGLAETGEELVCTVRGKSFLRYMVRKMVGTLLEVGRGRFTPEDIPRLLELKDRSESGPTAPPQGLCLVRVEYEEKWRI